MVCVPGSLTEVWFEYRVLCWRNTASLCSFPVWICFYDRFALANHGVDELIVHWENVAKNVLCRKEIKKNERNLFEASLHALTISLCKKRMQTSTEKSFKAKQWGLGMAKKGLKLVGDVQCSAIIIAHQSELGIQKCTALDATNLFQSFFRHP